MTDEVAGVDNAELDNDGLNMDGDEICANVICLTKFKMDNVTSNETERYISLIVHKHITRILAQI